MVYEARAEAKENAPATLDSRLVRADNQFGFELLKKLHDGRGKTVPEKLDPTGNVFISPASVAIALHMTLNGANGETRAEMERVLRLQGLSVDELNEANLSLHALLENPGSGVRLDVANSLWIDNRTDLKPGFLERDKTYYKADVGRLDLAKPESVDVINGWVSRKTEKRIPDLLSQLSPQAFLVLVNAIYFKGEWADKFDSKLTKPREFTLHDGGKKTVQMMSRKGDYQYLEEDSFQAVSLPYGDGRLGMYLFLPKPGHSLDELVGSLDAETWEGWMKLFGETPGTVELPRLELSYDVELRETLKSLGMEKAFDAGEADFGKMASGQAWIDGVVHKSFLKIDEEGTEAAAATAVMLFGRMPARPFKLTVDRPFFCAIRDNKTGLVLFDGSVSNPT